MLIGFHYCKHLWFAHFVIPLDQLHFLQLECYQVPLSCCFKQLWNDHQNCETRCVDFNYYPSSWVIMDQNWCGSEEPLEFFKCFFHLFCENKFLPLEFTLFSTFEHIWEGYSYLTKRINETAIEICKPEEFLNVFEWLREWPFYYGLNTTRVYWDTLLAHYESHAFNLYYIKNAFAKLNK